MTRILSASTLLVCGLVVGCEKKASSVPTAASSETPPASKGLTPAVNKSGAEGEARSAVKAALDSWAFGDTQERFAKSHPGVYLGDPNRITKRLASYAIGTVRAEGNKFDFLVTFTFKEDTGDVTRGGSYMVIKGATGQWEIFGGAH